LPSGRSDANHPAAVADAVADFWTLLVELDKRGQLPPEIFALEIGVGPGTRAGLWLDRFKALDEARGTGYYPRLRFLLADYSMPTLDRAHRAVEAHRDVVSTIATDALNPMRALSFLRYKILYVHLTNVYDNLPVDELVRRDGQLYLVETRAYLPEPAATAPADVRFHLSGGAVESFVNPVPLLHPRGYLQVQDIFVATMDEYRQGFRGPGKLDGSVVNWVNGALLRLVGARAGYDVHFAP